MTAKKHLINIINDSERIINIIFGCVDLFLKTCWER